MFSQSSQSYFPNEQIILSILKSMSHTREDDKRHSLAFHKSHQTSLVSPVCSSVLRLSSSPFPISVLSPRDGQTERRRDDGSRS